MEDWRRNIGKSRAELGERIGGAAGRGRGQREVTTAQLDNGEKEQKDGKR